MNRVDFTLDEHVALVTLQDGENRFNPEFLTSFIDVLQRVETRTDARALIVTSAHEKIYSNGIDLEWLVPVIQKNDLAAAKDFFYLLNRLLKTILTIPLTTVAAINGHAFAGGAIMCCAFDFRFMRTDRGFFCFPEVDLGIPFLPGMNALLKKAIPMYKLEEMQLTALRMTAQDCEAHHIVTKACRLEELMDEALAFAKGNAKQRGIVGEMKRRLHNDIVTVMDVEDVPYIESGQYNIS